MHNRIVEDSLENTLSCVPKGQGVTPNLSGKWTEMHAKSAVVHFEQSS